MAENQSQWPAQYPGYGLPAADQASDEAATDQEQPTAPPPTAQYVPPAGYQGYRVQAPPAGYQVPPAGYQVPPAGYQVPPGGYQVPPAGYQIPHGVYQNRVNSSMRAASADRERAVDVR